MRRIYVENEIWSSSRIDRIHSYRVANSSRVSSCGASIREAPPRFKKGLQFPGDTRRDYAIFTGYKQGRHADRTYHLHIVGIRWRENIEGTHAGFKACSRNELNELR